MSATSTSAPLAVLRIKRKRNEEPLDGLVFDLPRKKHRDTPRDHRRGTFRYVHTADENQDNGSTLDEIELQNKIAQLDNTSESPFKRPLDPSPTSARLSPKRPRQYSIVKTNTSPVLEANLSWPSGARPQSSPEPKPGYVLYDGVSSSRSAAEPAEEETPEMAQFNDMLRDYLSSHAPELSIAPQTNDISTDANADYVYDYFYYQSGFSSSLNNPGQLTLEAGDELEFLDNSDVEESSEEDVDDPDSNDEDNPANDYPDEVSSEASTEYSEWNEQGYDSDY